MYRHPSLAGCIHKLISDVAFPWQIKLNNTPDGCLHEQIAAKLIIATACQEGAIYSNNGLHKGMAYVCNTYFDI